MPLFSVIIPTFNRLPVLRRAVASVLQQTFRDFEVIVSDDGSTDGTSFWLTREFGGDSTKRVIWHPNSGLPSVARNRGIRMATGRYVCFLDSDDYWKPEKLEEVAGFFQARPECIGVSHQEEVVTGGRVVRILRNWRDSTRSLYENLLFEGNFLSTSAMSVDREALVRCGMFSEDPEFFIVEDYDLWMKLANVGKIGYIPKVLGAFVAEGRGISAKVELIHRNLKAVVFHHLSQLGLPPKQEHRMRVIHGSRVEYYLGRSLQMAGEWRRARRALSRSIKAYPVAWKKWASFVLALLEIA